MRDKPNKEIRGLMAFNLITLPMLAEAVGVHLSTINRWMASEREMTEERRERVLGAIESIIANDEREGA